MKELMLLLWISYVFVSLFIASYFIYIGEAKKDSLFCILTSVLWPLVLPISCLFAVFFFLFEKIGIEKHK